MSRRRHKRPDADAPEPVRPAETDPVQEDHEETPDATEAPEVAPEREQEVPPPAEPRESLEAPVASRAAVRAPSEYKPPPAGPRCPRCDKPLRVIVSQDQGRCAVCKEVVAIGEQVTQYLERRDIAEVAMAHFGLKPDDLVNYLPSPGAGGVKVIRQGTAVRLYTRTRSTMIFDLSMLK